MNHRHSLPQNDPRHPMGRWNLLIPGLRVFLRVLFVCAGLIGFGIMRSHASHLSGAELTHTCLGNGQYQFTLTLYRDCAGIPIGNLAPVLNLQNGCGVASASVGMTFSGTQDVSQLCPQDLAASTCNGGNLPGTQAFTFQTTPIALAPCADWTVSWTSNAEGTRNQAVLNLVNPGNAFMHIRSTLNTLADPCDQAPVFSSAPIPYVCLGTPVTYSFGATDADGHALSYALVAAQATATASLTYVAPHSPSAPIPGIVLDPTSGVLTFTPAQVGSFVVVVEVTQTAANGTVVGTVMRDIQFVVVPCLGTPPDPSSGTIASLTGTAQQDGPRELSLCGNGSFCFSATYTDNDPGSALLFSSNVEQVLPGATVNVAGSNPLQATICWNAVPGPTGAVTFTVTISDCGPGSLAILQAYTYTVLIDQADPLVITTGGDATANCPGDAVVLDLLSIQGGAPPLQISWTDATGTVVSNDPSLSVTVVQNTPFTATVTDQCGQAASTVVHALLATHDPLLLATSGDATVQCPGDVAVLSLASISGGAAPYTQLWTDGQGAPVATSNSISVPVLGSTLFTLTVTDQCGTSVSETLVVTTQVLQPLALTTTPDLVRCAEEPVVLEASVSGGAAPHTLFWVELGSTDALVTVAPAQPTSFTVIASDACGNTTTGTIAVGIERPEVSIVAVDLGNERWQFHAITPQQVEEHHWDFGDGGSSQQAVPQHQLTSLEPQEMVLTITTVNGCVASDTLLITPAGQIFFPNAFTPDGDGINDAFAPVGQGIVELRYILFDRWGSPVFQGDGPDSVWNGDLPDGRPAPSGVYALRYRVRTRHGAARDGMGHVSLLRGDMVLR